MISLPNGEERELSNTLSLAEKMEICENLVIEFDAYIEESRDSQPVIYFLNGLANYICWHKNDISERDRDRGILSNEKEKLVTRNRYHSAYRKDIVFSDMTAKEEMDIFGEMVSK